MSLTLEQIQHVAHLAKLALPSEMLPRYVKELSSILEFVNQLAKVDTTNVAPQSHPLDLNQRMRTDQITETDQRELFQTIAPRVEAGLYLVPQVIEDGE